MQARIFSISLTLLLSIAIGGCGSSSSEAPPEANIPAPGADEIVESDVTPQVDSAATLQGTPQETPPPVPKPEPFPEVVIRTSLGQITLQLDAEKAPETVDNFLISYVDQGFYQDTIFHYVEDGFIAIAGGYTADLQAKEARAPIRNEASNGLKNVRGTIAMSRHPDYIDSATSQFYINLADNPSLDLTGTPDPNKPDAYGYCVFGKVTAGMDVVDKIAKAKVADSGEFVNVPVQPIVIESIERVK